MTVLSPLWILLGLAIAVPIAVHLWSRKSGDPFLLGTFRFLPDDSFSKAKNIDLHEIPLLFVRILIVLTITLLLAQLFWTHENDPIHTVLITEVEGDQMETRENENGILNIELSSEKISEYKWWNLISQMDGDYQPNLIIAEGTFSRSRMGNVRQGVSAEVQWVEKESGISRLKTWSSGDEVLSSFVAERGNGGLQFTIQEFTGAEIIDSGEAVIDADTVQFSGQLRMLIDENTPASIQEGLIYTANHWNIEYQVGSVDGLMSIEMGGEYWVLQRSKSEGGYSEWIEANRVTSIGMNIRLNEHAENFDDVFLRTRSSNTPVFGKIDPFTFLVNGSVEEELERWFYAGVGHQILKNILEVDEVISPVISNKERTMNVREASLPYRDENLVSARLWLLGLLLIFWLIERTIAPARGM